MTPETLTTRRLNRALLARQHLLERAQRPLPQVLEDVGGLQMQYAPSGYIGLWSRMAGFSRPMLTTALEDREVVQATLMRATIHLVSAADFWPMTAGIRRQRREWFARVAKDQIAGLDMDAVAQAIREEVAQGPLKQAVITERLAARGFHARAASWVGHWVDLIRVPPSGTWDRRRADLYGLAENWLPIGRQPSEEEGLDLLVRRYLGGFGPSSRSDIANWAGVGTASLDPVIERLELRRFRDVNGTDLVDLPGAPLPPEDSMAPVRFLPTWDATLLVHARRTQILPEGHRPRVFNTKTPHSVGTFLVDGHVAGTWRYERGAIRTEAFGRMARTVRREVDEEAARLAEFHAA